MATLNLPDDTSETLKAVGRLIAAAPEMLAICENIVDALTYPRGSEAQIRCLEEIAQDAARIVARAKRD